MLDADAKQYNYGLRLPGQQIELGHGPEHRHRCLEALALYPGDNSDNKPSTLNSRGLQR